MPVYKPNLFYPQECREKGYTRVLFARHLLTSCTLYPKNYFRTGTLPDFYFGGLLKKDQMHTLAQMATDIFVITSLLLINTIPVSDFILLLLVVLYV